MARPRVNQSAPLTDSEKLARSRLKLDSSGGRRININLPADAAAALSALVKSGYGEKVTEVISRALIEAADRFR